MWAAGILFTVSLQILLRSYRYPRNVSNDARVVNHSSRRRLFRGDFREWSAEHNAFYFHRKDGSGVTWTRPAAYESDDDGERPRTESQVSLQ